LIQGKLRRSCTVPIKKIAGQEIVTIEGLGTPDQLHPIQEAFIETGAIQCGFCTPGMIIATKALLDSNPRPSLDEIKKGLVRNLCRCTGYVKIFDAVRLASERLTGSRSTSTDQGKRNAVGVSIPLLDGIEKATGRGQYGDDLFLPGMLHGKVVRSPHAHAEILGIDAREASAMPGVRAVLSAADIDGPNLYGRFVKDQPVLCGDRARLVGDPVALVVAETEKQAEDAALRVAVNYNPLPGVFDAMEALRETASKLHPTGNICAEKKIFSGDGEKGFRESEHILQKTYVTPFAEHAYMEPEAGVGYIDEDGRLVVAAGTQSAHFTQKEVAYALGLEKEHLAALKLRRPVKIRYSRQESMATTYKRHPFRMDLKVGTKRDGSLCAIHTNYFANTGAYTGSGIGVFTRAMLHSTGPYHFPHVNLSVTGVFTNNPNSSGMRGFGVPQVALAIESHLDQLAQELGIDPWEMRYKNAYTSEHILPTGHPIPGNVEMRPCLEAIRPYYESMKSDVAKRNRDSRGARYGVGTGRSWFGLVLQMWGRGQLLAWLKLQPMSSEFPLTW
jgi:CO/xanthine dehydrogenase Mo-binding subunit